MTTLKIHFAKDNIRRIKLTNEISSFDDFSQFLTESYKEHLNGEVLIQYFDQDGDLISVSSQLEWEEMIHTEGDYIKLYIKSIQPADEGRGRCHRGFAGRGCPRRGFNGFPGGFAFRRCPRGFEGFGTGGGCGNFADFARESTPEETSPEVNTDSTSNNNPLVGLFGLVRKGRLQYMHNKALTLMSVGDEESLDIARDLLVHIIKNEPSNNIALYNLACAESLIGNIDEAITQLKNAIAAGYDDLQHLIEDPDFENIRYTNGFDECVQLFSNAQDHTIPPNETPSDDEVPSLEEELNETPVPELIETPSDDEVPSLEEELNETSVPELIETPAPTPVSEPIETPVKEPESPFSDAEDVFATIRTVLIDMGIEIEEEKLKELCNRFSNNVTQIVNHYFRSLY
jgi:hypothetical protein